MRMQVWLLMVMIPAEVGSVLVFSHSKYVSLTIRFRKMLKNTARARLTEPEHAVKMLVFGHELLTLRLQFRQCFSEQRERGVSPNQVAQQGPKNASLKDSADSSPGLSKPAFMRLPPLTLHKLYHSFIVRCSFLLQNKARTSGKVWSQRAKHAHGDHPLTS